MCEYKDVYFSVIQGKYLAHACKIINLLTTLQSSYRNKYSTVCLSSLPFLHVVTSSGENSVKVISPFSPDCAYLKLFLVHLSVTSKLRWIGQKPNYGAQREVRMFRLKSCVCSALKVVPDFSDVSGETLLHFCLSLCEGLKMSKKKSKATTQKSLKLQYRN